VVSASDATRVVIVVPVDLPTIVVVASTPPVVVDGSLSVVAGFDEGEGSLTEVPPQPEKTTIVVRHSSSVNARFAVHRITSDYPSPWIKIGSKTSQFPLRLRQKVGGSRLESRDPL